MLNCLVMLSALLSPLPAPSAGNDILPPPPELQAGSTTYVEVSWATTRMWGWWGNFEDAPVLHRSRTIGWWQHVESVAPDGGLRLTLTFDRQACILTDPDEAFSFDSDVDDPDDEANALAPLLAPVVGRSIAVEVDSQRRVVRVEGISEIWEEIAADAQGNEHLEMVGWWFEVDSMRYLIGQVLMLYPTGDRFFGRRWGCTLEQHAARSENRLAYGRLERRDGRMNVDVCYDFDIAQTDECSVKYEHLTWTRLQLSGRGHGSAAFDQGNGNLVSAIEVGQQLMRARYESPEYEEPDVVDTFDRYRQQTICLTPEERAAQKAQRKADTTAGGD